MIFKTAYDTTACRGFVLGRTVHALKAAMIHGALKNVDFHGIRMVTGAQDISSTIPSFGHPILLSDTDSEEVLVIDGRPFGRWDPIRYEFVVKNAAELKLLEYRARLTAIWLFDRPELIRDVSPAPMAIYASLLSETVARRYALDPREQFDFAIAAALFYGSLFMADDKLEDKDKNKLAAMVARATRAKAEDVFAILDQVETMPADIFDFCNFAKTVTKSVRLEEFNPGVLFSLIGGTWYGTGAKEMLAVALEHPPTWVAIVLTALNERGFKNSTVAKTSERLLGRDDDFVRAVKRITDMQ